VTYPFPQAATDAVKGDFTNLRITADLDLRTVLTNLNGGKDPGLPDLPAVPDPTGTGLPSLPSLPTGPSLPTLPTLPTVTVPPVPGVTSTPAVTPTCVVTICLGRGSGSTTRAAGAYDTNLAALLLGGLS